MTTQGSTQKKIEEFREKFVEHASKCVEPDCGLRKCNIPCNIPEHQMRQDILKVYDPKEYESFLLEALEAQRQEYLDALRKRRKEILDSSDWEFGDWGHGHVAALDRAINLIDQSEKEGGDK